MAVQTDMELLISLIVVLAIIGIAWWAITQIPMPPPIRIAATVIVAVIAILFLLQFVGGGLHLVR
jgi:hypothetical protein